MATATPRSFVLIAVVAFAAQLVEGRSTNGNCSVMTGVRVNGGDVGSATVTSAGACCEACNAHVGCGFYTFVASKSLCWLKSNGEGTHQDDADCISGVANNPEPFSCSANIDCNHAGTCTNKKCVCDDPFHGDACEQFTLYSYRPGQGGFEMPQGNATWGGSVVEADDGSWHIFAALMAGNGTLSVWLHGSQVAHGISKTGPQGPFTFSDVALSGRGGDYWDAVTCHNPDTKRTPDGMYVIYYMGSRGATDDLEFNQRVGMAWSKSPYGPWTRSAQPIVMPGVKGTWDDGFTTNPAPYIYPNGTVLLIYKARSLENKNGMFEGVAIASGWNSTYIKHSTKPLDLPSNCEDAGIYRTNAGVFRMLTHCGCAGQYMWSLDGFVWNRTTTPQPWCTNIPYTDNTNGTLATRQRPKWVINNQGVATHVMTGVNRPNDGQMGHVWTMAATVTKPSV